MLRIEKTLIVAALGMMLALTSSCGSKKDGTSASAQGSNGKVEVLAQVGSQKITSADLEQALVNLPEGYQAVAMTFKGKRQILDNLIKKSLLIQEAEDRGFQKEEAVKQRVKEYEAQSQARVKQQIADLQRRLSVLDKQVYENVMLTELNERLKQDTARLKEVEDSDVQTYYEDYVRKLKMLNPAAVPPKQETVAEKIRAILVEEQMLEDLEKKNKVDVQEGRFRQRYGDAEKNDVVIEDSTTE